MKYKWSIKKYSMKKTSTCLAINYEVSTFNNKPTREGKLAK